MAAAKADILDAIGKMTVLELAELIKQMEEKFGVSAAAPAVAAAAPAAGGAAAVEEQTEFAVILKTVGDNKVNVWMARPSLSKKAFPRLMPKRFRSS